MYVDAPFRTAFDYTDYFFLGPAYNRRAKTVLFLGLGGGSAPKRLGRDFPELRLQVVELDSVVVDVARRFFSVPETLPVAVADGRRYRARLAPGGVVVTNVLGAVTGPSSKLFRAVYRTYRSVFPTVTIHPGYGSDTYGNSMLVAIDGAAPTTAFVRERRREMRAAHPSAPRLDAAITQRYDSFVPTGDVPTLTDAYAPVDALLAVH